MTVPSESYACPVPVALFAFNRPAQTATVFEAIRRARPARLLIVCDGPRTGHPTDAARCAEVRAVVANVDWPCEVSTNVSPVNLGCRYRMATGLNWVFTLVERAIVVEDDIVTGLDFFRFCEAMLDHYADDRRIGVINGSFLPAGSLELPGSYTFSRYPLVWGWATWRDRWRRYDYRFDGLEQALASGAFAAALGRPDVAQYYENEFRRVGRGEVDTWDYALAFTSLANHWLNVTPTRNLVSNIGFGPEATHTKGDSPLAAKPIRALDWPLEHPATLARSVAHDDVMEAPIIANMEPWTQARAAAAAPPPPAAEPVAFYGLGDLDRLLAERLDFDGGVFFEAGANDGLKQSNTLHFERHRGWTGVLVEPSPTLFRYCAALRTRAQCFNAALVPPDWREPGIDMVFCDLMSVTDSDRVAVDRVRHVETGRQFLAEGVEPYRYRAPARTVSAILDEAGVSAIDLLVLDVEGFEEPVLRGVDFDRFTIRNLCLACRDLDPVRAAIPDRYEIVAKLTHHDYLFALRAG